MSKRAVRILVLGTVLVGAAAGGGWLWWQQRGHVSTDNAYVQGDVTTIAPKVIGYVTEVAVEDTDRVRAGDVLVRIDDRDYRAHVAEAEAAVQAARAALVGYDRRLEAQDVAIAEAEAGLATWQADLELARKELARTGRLARQDFASRQNLDAAQAALDKAQAGLAQAKAKRDTARSQVAVIEADRARQQAQLAEAEAKLELARVDLENTLVRAPVDGVVGNRGVRLGQLVSAGTPLMSVVPLDSVWVDANFKETQIGDLEPGQLVHLSVDAFPGKTLTGRVGGLSPASGAQFSLLPPENATGNFTKIVQRLPVRIEIEDAGALAGRLYPGLSVVVDVDTTAPVIAADGEGARKTPAVAQAK